MTAPHRHFRRLGAGAVALALLTSVFATIPAGAAAAAPGVITPVIDANFADPDLLLVDGVYHAYGTNNDGQNVQHRTSTDLKKWTAKPDVAPTLGDWVGDCSFAPGGATDKCVWAPEVSKVAGGYALYYTARDELAARQCIGVSVSKSPNGPFTPVGTGPLVCPDGQRGTEDLGGAIDASTYQENGKLYLLWKSDGNCCGKPATLFLQPLAADGKTLTGPPTELIHNTQRFEGAVVEAPTLVKHGAKYYLFYSANDFGGGNYRTGWATATKLAGPYTKSDTELMTTDLFHGTVIGPGGQDIITTRTGGTAIVFHGWDAAYTYRGMYLSDFSWTSGGTPVVAAAAQRYQAEDGKVSNARVVGDDSASGQAKVGGLDNLNSSVNFRVRADRSGPMTMGIRYGNGSRDGNIGVAATQTVKVNGRAAGTVTLPNTAWGNWTTAEYQVTLKKGWNDITLTKATWFAELDAIDIYPTRPMSPPTKPPAGVTPVRYEAEAGVVVHANIGNDGGASGGAKVGGLDFADSSVTVTVNAPQGGRTVIGIRFGSGSLDRSGYPVIATDKVSVNGNPVGTVSFPHTTWGNWQTAYFPVKLVKGSNTITLTRGSFYAELDAIDLYPQG